MIIGILLGWSLVIVIKRQHTSVAFRNTLNNPSSGATTLDSTQSSTFYKINNLGSLQL
jgi:hypothetical protein